MPTSSTLKAAQQKRADILTWIKGAISKAEAEERGMVPISRVTAIRNWTCREALYDHAQAATQAKPLLVIVAVGRAALYAVPASKR